MTGRRIVRALLRSAGLLDVAREARGAASSLAWFRDNSPTWLHGAADGLPVPPLHLVRASTGTSSLRWLFEGGALAAGSIVEILSANGVAIGSVRSMLDFGCGCGRVTRQWTQLGAAIHGSDYNARSIAWCRRNLPFASFEINQLTPPLPYRDGQFDLVYALSVFTHLPEPLLGPWMREMERILTPDGLLIVSTHGEACITPLDGEQQTRFRSGRAVVRDEESAGTNRCGVYLPEAYVRTQLAGSFRILEFRPQGARGNPPQDLALLQKPAFPLRASHDPRSGGR